MKYSAVNNQGNLEIIYTRFSDDGVERVCAVDTAYIAVHGPGASVGSSWELAFIGEDEYEPGVVAQVWVESLKDAPIFDPTSYSYIVKGWRNPLTMYPPDD